ncbi:polymorphic toxin type 50 domain-containing protein [Enterococcus sp. DIV0800]|uniref:polymorphic toxin type 50 domain-containing protein n=1 Tax=unclassified Enterococcus TaxID=2608891 RepID=UPI003D2F9F37
MASSAEYWKKRMDEVLAYVDRTDIDFFGELQSIYQEYYQKTTKELFSFYQRYAKDNKISLKEAKQRLMREDMSDYRINAEKYFKQAKDAKDGELLKRLNEQYSAAKVTRLEAVNLEIEWLMGRMNQELNQSFYSYLKDTAKHVFRKVRFGNSTSTVSDHILDQIVHMPWNGRNYSEQIWGNTDNLGKDIRDVFTKGFIKGSGPAEIARELRKKYNVTRAQSETLIQTDGTNVINNATVQRFRDAGLEKYQFWAHIDDDTTETCRNHHKKVYLIKDYQPGLNAPPLHYRCRSTVLPDDEELGMEDSWQDEVAKRNKEYADKKGKKKQTDKDEKFYQKFKNVLKDSAPSFDDFVKMKYNEDRVRALKRQYNDAKLQQRIKDGKYNVTVHEGKQGKHIIGHNNYKSGKSYLLENVDPQQLVNEFAGTGEILRRRNGDWANKELIFQDEFIGVNIEKDTPSQIEFTKGFTIHYSKKGVHIVPTVRKGEKQ